FEKAGVKEVSTDWKLDPGIMNDHGWVALTILTPNQIVSEAAFKVQCNKAPLWVALQLSGQGHASRNEWDKAIAAYSRSLDLNRKVADTWHLRALAYFELKNWEKAAADFGEVINLEPTDPRAWVGRGAARNNLGKYREGIADYTEAIRLDRKLALAWQN